MLKYIFGVCLLVSLAAAKHEQYEGYAFYSLKLSSQDEASFLNNLQSKYKVNILTSGPIGYESQVLVAKNDKSDFEKELKNVNLKFNIVSDNVKEQLDLEEQRLFSAKSRSNRTRDGALPLDTVYTYEEIDAYIEELASRYPEKVTLSVAGHSIEGREIKYLKISTTNFEDESKPIVMLQTLLHAREWITQAASLYALQKLLIDVTEPDLVENIDWIIVPMVNPDGFITSYDIDRFWRKNTNRNEAINLCYGVDLNRNFGVNWGQFSSSSVCSDTYHGTGPFSEPETVAIKNIFDTYGARIQLYIDIHSFGSMILYGYGSGVLPINALGMHVVGVAMAEAIDRVKWPQNPNYVVGNIALVLFLASGGASDYGTAVGVPFSYAYELPAFMNYDSLVGFLVDPDFVEQAGFETWEGIKVGARFVAENTKKGKSTINNMIMP